MAPIVPVVAGFTFATACIAFLVQGASSSDFGRLEKRRILRAYLLATAVVGEACLLASAAMYSHAPTDALAASCVGLYHLLMVLFLPLTRRRGARGGVRVLLGACAALLATYATLVATTRGSFASTVLAAYAAVHAIVDDALLFGCLS